MSSMVITLLNSLLMYRLHRAQSGILYHSCQLHIKSTVSAQDFWCVTLDKDNRKCVWKHDGEEISHHLMIEFRWSEVDLFQCSQLSKSVVTKTAPLSFKVMKQNFNETKIMEL